jgi:hypothetical protein
LVPAQTLYKAVSADPSAPLAVCITAPGGYGKSALLAALRQAYLTAGVSVVGTGAVPVEVTPSSDVAVLVDDAHQLDGPGLDRLRRLALTGDVRLIVAYRPWPRKPELDELEDAVGGHHPPVLLDRLDRRGIQMRCAARLGGALPAPVIDLLCEQTGGVPMLVDWAVDSLPTGGRLDGDRPDLPPGVVDRVRHGLDRLGPQLRALLLAVGLGAAPDSEILAEVLVSDPAVVVDLLSMAQAAGLLLGDGRMIPLVRRAIVAGSAPGARRVVQRLALAACSVWPTSWSTRVLAGATSQRSSRRPVTPPCPNRPDRVLRRRLHSSTLRPSPPVQTPRRWHPGGPRHRLSPVIWTRRCALPIRHYPTPHVPTWDGLATSRPLSWPNAVCWLAAPRSTAGSAPPGWDRRRRWRRWRCWVPGR